MAWTASITGLEQNDDYTIVYVSVTDGVVTKNTLFRADQPFQNTEWLRQRIVDFTTKLDAQTSIGSIPLGTFSLAAPTPPPPDQAAIDRAAYYVALSKLQNGQRLAESGVLGANDKILSDLRSDVSKKFKQEYLA